MDLNCAHAILALAAPPSAAGTQPNPKAQMFQTFGMLALMGVMFYFLLIRPQQKKAKDHAAMLKTVRPGDKIVTSGGIFGVVLSVKEKTLTIRSADAKLEITKSAIAEITERSGDTSAD
jgi:preprotein translocase subunit YajC